MTFSNARLAQCCCCIAMIVLVGCAVDLNKNKAATNPSEVVQNHQKGDAEITTNSLTLLTVLPAGPATPNPYLKTKVKVNDQVENSFQVAVTLMQQKNWSQAELVLQSLAAENPTLSGIHLNLGIVYRAKNDNVKAAEAFSHALAANSKNLDAYNQLALVEREAGNFMVAESLYQKALGVWPFHPDSHKNIAILYELYLGKTEQALPHYQAYQQLLAVPDKQVDSWIADLQRRLAGAKNNQKDEPK